MSLSALKYYLTFLVLAALFTFDTLASGTSYYYYKAKLDVSPVAPVASGTVYISNTQSDSPKYQSSSEASGSQRNNQNVNLYLYAKAATSEYNYVEWIEGTEVQSMSALDENLCASWQTQMTATSTSNSNPTTKNYTARFGKSMVTVSLTDNSVGKVTVSPMPNSIGDEVTISAELNGNHYNIEWRKKGSDEVVSTERSFTIQVTEEAEYVATVSKPLGYYYLRNKQTGKVLNVYDDYLSYRKMIGSGSALIDEIQLNSEGIYVPRDPSNCPQYKALFNHATSQLRKDIRLMSSQEAKYQQGTVIDVSGNTSNAFNFNILGTSLIDITTGPCPLNALLGTTVINVPGMPVNLDGLNNNFKIFMNLKIPVTALNSSVNFGPVYLVEDATGKFSVVQTAEEAHEWEFVPFVDNFSAGIPDMYFSVSANDFVQTNDGNYYTILRTDFNYRFDPTKVSAYIVKVIDDENYATLTQVESDVIPKGQCVILCCKSMNEDVALLPTKDTSSFDFSGNLLKNQITPLTEPSYNSYYNYAAKDPSGLEPYPHKSCYVHPADFSEADGYRTLMVENGELVFGGNPVTKPNGYQGYLQANGTVHLTKSITLAQLIANGVEGSQYVITDLTAVDVVDDELIICKDDNGYANPDAMPEGETWVDYMSQSKASIENDLNLNGREEGITATVPAPYDQSNWIALHLPEGPHVTRVKDWQGRQLTGVKGRLLNKTNPEFQLDAMPTSGEDVTIAPNVYVAASFNGYNHQQGTKAPFIGTEFFFVQPKPMELATIGWAQCDAEYKQFVVPYQKEGLSYDENNPEWNTAGLSGHFGFNGSLLEQEQEQEGYAPLLQDGHSYLMPALIKYKVGGNSQPASAPRRAGEVAKEYVAYPLRLVQTTKEVNGVITGVTAIGGSRAVAGVDYYNLAGQRSSRPWQGVNIVVTRYTDGTTSTCKQIKN